MKRFKRRSDPKEEKEESKNLKTAYSKSGVEAQKHIYWKLRDRGFTDKAAKAMVVNLTYESDNFRATEEYEANNVGTKGLGIAQWTDTKYAKRRTAFENHLSANETDASDLDANVSFLIKELTGKAGYNTGASIDAMNKASDTVENGSMYVLNKFERPIDQSSEHNNKRLKMSNEFLTSKLKDPLKKEIHTSSSVSSELEGVPYSRMNTINNLFKNKNRY